MTTTEREYPKGSHENQGDAFEIPITLKITQYGLANIIIDAMEGGVHGIIYWCPKVRLRTTKYEGAYDPAEDGEGADDLATDWDEEREAWNEFLARNVALGGSITLYESEDESAHPKLKAHTLTRTKLLHGIKQWLTNHRPEGMDVSPEGIVEFDMDGPQADVILQYALFQKVIYG